MTTNKKSAHDEGFIEGVQYALDYLSSLYESIEETDLYKEYMTKEAN